jgi:hypothetical protein
MAPRTTNASLQHALCFRRCSTAGSPKNALTKCHSGQRLSGCLRDMHFERRPSFRIPDASLSDGIQTGFGGGTY